MNNANKQEQPGKSNRPDHIRHSRQVLAAKRHRLAQRHRITNAIRHALVQQAFLEVETPIRIESPAPEAHIVPQPSGTCFLAASPELQMKQMVAAGFERIFQIRPCFRANEYGTRHLPEFTMLEWYRRGGTLASLETDCRHLVSAAARAVNRYPKLEYQGDVLHLDRPWPVLDIKDVFEQVAGWRPGSTPDAARFDLDLVNYVEPSLPTDTPVFLSGYPTAMASLSKRDPQDASRALRMELYAGGVELANGFEELTDPIEQRARFETEEAYRRKMGQPPFELDEDFLGALTLGMPDCAGMALGLDRLVMLLTDAPTIEDVVAFCPSLR